VALPGGLFPLAISSSQVRIPFDGSIVFNAEVSKTDTFKLNVAAFIAFNI
jgi:hypothetical protein